MPDEEDPALLAEPDFELIANHLVEVSDHVNRCRRLPSIDQGAAVLRAINQLSEQMANMQRSINDLDRKVDTVSARIGRVETKVDDNHKELTAKIEQVDHRIQVSHDNNSARLENNIDNKETATDISPLRNVHTGDVIEGFPATTGEAIALNDAEITRILAELGMSTRGTAHDKKFRMLLTIGVFPCPAFGQI
ncbi:hypothetical protein NM208_g10693 [Fusarium decemcellulare]|uniref:Uncharacterized protein n=1 Tax=Fusarium decemcellulare TaxID=57161 RepID=A0ACC1RX09_9HYPO|nr:hypothetical protein NM208_g10693 [Fusarium decemcellulare]